MKTTTGTPSNSNVSAFPTQSTPSQTVTKNAAELEVLGKAENGTDQAGARKGEGADQGDDESDGQGGGDFAVGSQLSAGVREDVGDLIERRGMRAKALDELDRMLGAVTYLWDAGKQSYNEAVDYTTRMKAIGEILNRTDGLPKRYMEVLQAIAHGESGKSAPRDVEITPKTAATLRGMLNDFDKKQAGGPRSEKRGQITPGKRG